VREHSRRRRPESESAGSASAEDDASRAKGRLRPQISAAEATLYKEYDDEVSDPQKYSICLHRIPGAYWTSKTSKIKQPVSIFK
jgi:hypothetical protein